MGNKEIGTKVIELARIQGEKKREERMITARNRMKNSHLYFLLYLPPDFAINTWHARLERDRPRVIDLYEIGKHVILEEVVEWRATCRTNSLSFYFLGSMRMHVAVKLRFVGRRIFSFFYFIRNFLFLFFLIAFDRGERKEKKVTSSLVRWLSSGKKWYVWNKAWTSLLERR